MRWLAFLNDLWPDDPEARAALQELVPGMNGGFVGNRGFHGESPGSDSTRNARRRAIRVLRSKRAGPTRG